MSIDSGLVDGGVAKLDICIQSYKEGSEGHASATGLAFDQNSLIRLMPSQRLDSRSPGADRVSTAPQPVSTGPTRLGQHAGADTLRYSSSDAEEELEALSHGERKVMMDFADDLENIAHEMVDGSFNIAGSEFRVQGLSAQADISESKYERLGMAENIEKAVECRGQVLSLTQDGHAERLFRLATLGVSLTKKFERLGDLADINMAIQHLTEAMYLTPDGDPNYQSMLGNLGVAYQRRFGRLGELADLDKAIEYITQAGQFIPDGHLDKPGWLNNLGASYMRRFERFGELADIDNAIERQTQSTQLAPDGHPGKPDFLSNLGVSCLRRYERLGELADLENAINYHTHAVQLTPDDLLNKLGFLRNLGASYMRRFERLGELADLDNAIERQTQAVRLAPDGHPNKSGLLLNLGFSHTRRFERLGELADLDNAIEHQTQAVQLTPDDHYNKPGSFNNLGTSYMYRFERLGELADIDNAIERQTQAVQLTPDGHPNKHMLLNNLGNSYGFRFEHLGELPDVDKAIECQSRATQLTPDDHLNKPCYLSNLGSRYTSRFARLSELSDLNKGLECHTHAVQLTPDGHPAKSSRLNSLGNSYLLRFERLGELFDADRAAECHSEALQLTPNGDPRKPRRFDNLGRSYRYRFKKLGDTKDLDQAIICNTQAVLLTPSDHPEKPVRLDSLGIICRLRFERFGELPDVEKAVHYHTQAVQLTPGGHACQPNHLASLGESYMSRFKCYNGHEDLQHARLVFQQAAQLALISPKTQLSCAREWARTSALLGLSPQQAYERCMKLVPHLIWLGSTIDHRYTLLTHVSQLATEAASWAISVQCYDLAIEWLEEGRSIVWSQILQLRSEFDQLSTANPTLAQHLKDIASQLEHAGSRRATEELCSTPESDLEKAARNHRRLAAEWEQCLEQAHTIPGFESFMRPRKAAELKRAATEGPIVLINTHSTRSDALILIPQSDEVIHLPLVEIPLIEAVESRCAQLDSMPMARHRSRSGRAGGFGRVKQGIQHEDLVKTALAGWWSVVVKPILSALECTPKVSPDELPHVTWCATGLLAFVPLHAACPYDGSSPNAFDLIVSSYTPTLSALLTSNGPVKEGAGVLAVGQADTKGHSPLPNTVHELAALESHVKATRFLRLDGENATVNAVLSAMEDHSWVHLACHATHNSVNLGQSAFHLHDGNLTLEALSKCQFQNKGLAFLSACQTAQGDGKLPDEAVHLAAGMLMAGYPSVIATMWSINDVDGPEVAGRVYAELLKDGTMDHRGAARALHKAVAELRQNIGVDSFERWVPFIHIGV